MQNAAGETPERRKALQLADRIAWPERVSTWDAANEAYAGEMLAALLPGAPWTIANEGRFWALIRHDGDLAKYLLQYTLDHMLVFRRTLTKGRRTWASTALIGRPYDAIYSDGTLSSDTAEDAARLAKLGLGVWIRPDLSSWAPGRTQLVIAAAGLETKSAAEFGFIDITGRDQ